MKKLYAVAGVLLLAVMLSSIGLAAADVNLELTAKSSGHLWYIKTGDILGDGSKIVDGTHLTLVQAYYFVDGVQFPIPYDRIAMTFDKVTLYFDHKQLPDHADTIWVTGMVDGQTFLAAGEGFTWGRK